MKWTEIRVRVTRAYVARLGDANASRRPRGCGGPTESWLFYSVRRGRSNTRETKKKNAPKNIARPETIKRCRDRFGEKKNTHTHNYAAIVTAAARGEGHWLQKSPKNHSNRFIMHIYCTADDRSNAIRTAFMYTTSYDRPPYRNSPINRKGKKKINKKLKKTIRRFCNEKKNPRK